MHTYRTHNCEELRKTHVDQEVKLSGWIHRVRDHGGVLFIDLRDTYGLTQCVVDEGSPLMEEVSKWRNESVITISGKVKARTPETINSDMATGEVEIYIDQAELLSAADVIPFQVAEDDGAGEDIRLKFRYIDLRRQWMQDKIRLRNNVVFDVRNRMQSQGFQEFQTPILTASSPEGARDFLVPSRLHPGKFYALPQAPQQFKQLLMMSGFDKYFQIAPCFRDEDSRANRLAEHYQLDVEMSFVEQQDIFNTMEPVLSGVFESFGQGAKVEWHGQIPYKEAMLTYGSDKPDLRNPLKVVDVTEVFARDDVEFKAFKGVIEKGGVVRAIKAMQVAEQPRSFFDKLNSWAQGEGAPGLGYILFEGSEGKGPIAKFVAKEAQEALRALVEAQDGDAVFFVCNQEKPAAEFAGKARDKICHDMDILEKDVFKFCWIVDFPMYEFDDNKKKIEFCHNPFCMPKGGLEALESMEPLEIMAQQYDCVCNGQELASGAIRNHRPEIMEKAFSVVGYDISVLEERFGGMLNAMRYGAPPHGGCAFGIDRIVMLLAGEENLREINAFVMNGAYEDLMMGAPSDPMDGQLKDLHIKLDLPRKAEKNEKAA